MTNGYPRGWYMVYSPNTVRTVCTDSKPNIILSLVLIGKGERRVACLDWENLISVSSLWRLLTRQLSSFPIRYLWRELQFSDFAPPPPKRGGGRCNTSPRRLILSNTCIGFNKSLFSPLWITPCSGRVLSWRGRGEGRTVSNNYKFNFCCRCHVTYIQHY